MREIPKHLQLCLIIFSQRLHWCGMQDDWLKVLNQMDRLLPWTVPASVYKALLFQHLSLAYTDRFQ